MQPVIRLTQLFKNSPTLAVGSMIVTLAILTSIFSVYIIPFEGLLFLVPFPRQFRLNQRFTLQAAPMK